MKESHAVEVLNTGIRPMSDSPGRDSQHHSRVSFQCFPEIASLIMKRWENAEARGTLDVSNLGCKPLCGLWARPNELEPEEEREMMLILQDLHGLSPEEARQATANSWPKVEAGLSCLLRLGETDRADVKRKTLLNKLRLDDVQAKYVSKGGEPAGQTKKQLIQALLKWRKKT